MNLTGETKHEASGLPIGVKIDATSAKRPVRTMHSGRYVIVAPLDPLAHAQSLYEGTHGANKEAFWLYMSEGPFADAAAFRAYLDKLAHTEDPLSFSIIDRATNRAVGHASYMRITPEHRVIEIGNIFYTPALAGTRGATEAMYLLAQHAFADLGYRRYEWKCNALNVRSRRAALRLGFAFEGLFRQHMIQKGRNRDTAWYSMLDTEWPSYKTAYEQYLTPQNFDAQGRELKGLSLFLNAPKQIAHGAR
jgi:RimJ/RimL family protein N-acetyltransferase